MVSRQHVAVSGKEAAEDGFIRLLDRPPHDSRVTASTSPQPSFDDDNRNHVRNDVHVGVSDERPRLNDEATG